LIKRKFLHTITFFILLILSQINSSCSGENLPNPTKTPPVGKNQPKIITADLDSAEVPRYKSIEIKIEIEAEYSNPYDAREIRLDGKFKGPDGSVMKIPGFWDGEEFWRVRFTPSTEGEWVYELYINDHRGSSHPKKGTFFVVPSNLHG